MQFEEEMTKKDFISIIACAKNEDNIIVDWILHNFSIGIDYIYLIDDNSTICIFDILKEDIRTKHLLNRITIYRVEYQEEYLIEELKLENDYLKTEENQLKSKNSFKSFGIKRISFFSTLELKINDLEFYESKQVYLYNLIYNKVKTNSKWFYVCDVDEFLMLKTMSLIDYLNTNDNYNCIYIPWIMFGNSYHIKYPKNEKSIVENFHLCDSVYMNLGKSIFKRTNKVRIHLTIPTIPTFSENYATNATIQYNSYVLNLTHIHKHKSIFTDSSEIHINHYHSLDLETTFTRKLFTRRIDSGTYRSFDYVKNLIKDYNFYNTVTKKLEDVKIVLLNDVILPLIKSITKEQCKYLFENNLVQVLSFETAFPDFVWSDYIFLNKDLSSMNEFEAKYHYLSFGLFENRKIILIEY